MGITSVPNIGENLASQWLARMLLCAQGTAGVLVIAIATSVLAALHHPLVGASIVLSTASATALAVVDLVYVTRQVLNHIYLADAAAEALVQLGWLAVLRLRLPPSGATRGR
jgi:hypothetical protein